MEDDEAQKLIDLLYEYFDRKGIDVAIKEYNFDFEFDFDVNNLDLSKISAMLTTLTELNKGVLIQYDTEIQLFWPKMTAYFDRIEDEEMDVDADEEEEF